MGKPKPAKSKKAQPPPPAAATSHDTAKPERLSYIRIHHKLSKAPRGASLSDPLVKGLRYQHRGRGKVYADWRGWDRTAKKRLNKQLGRLCSEEELLTLGRAQGTTGLAIANAMLDRLRAQAIELNRQLEAGADPLAQSRDLTLREARDLHVQAMRNAKRSERSITDIHYFTDRFLSDWLDVPLRRLTRDMLEERHKEIGTNAGQVSANKAMKYLRALVNEARARDATLPSFPAKFPWFEERPKEAAIPLAQLPTWFADVAAMQNEMKRDYYLLGVLTGVRRESLSSIKREDIDLDARTLFIPKPKGGETRAYTIPLSDAAMVVMRRRLAATNKEWLFPSASSKSGHIEEPRPEKRDRISVPFTTHGLRHTYISASHDADGVNLYRAKQLANHKVPKSDAHGAYSHRNVEALRAPQQRITEYLRQHGLPL